MYKAYRQIITYDSKLGHKYVPNLKVRMRYGSDSHFLHTDENGFRNSVSERAGKLKILILGDSYAAGDGVANQERFSDYLERHMDCKVTNLAVNGYGVDQQVLVYEQFKDQISHDLVILAPHMDDLYRNMRSFRVGKDRSGKSINIPKPFFKLSNDKLELENVPVPLQREASNISDTEQSDSSLRAFHSLKNQIKYTINRNIGKNLLGKMSYAELNTAKSDEWQLMIKLMERLKLSVGDKPLLLCPIPYNYIVATNEPQYYHKLFRSTLPSGFTLVDPLSELQTFYSAHPKDTFLPLCGHFSVGAHAVIGKFLVENLLLLGATKRSEQIDINISGNKGLVLGISCYYHDSAAAIIQNGRIIAAAQEERFTRKKHDKSFPFNAIHYCLEESGAHINDLEGICYYDDEAWTIERIINNYAVLEGELQDKFWELAAPGVARKLTLKQTLKAHFNYSGEVYKSTHHHSHAASAFYPSPFERAAIVVVDGVGEWACSTIGMGKGTQIELLKQQNYPHSLGLLYSAITYFCGFKVNSGEYKLMGLAPYGKPVYTDIMKKHLLTINEDGSIKLNLKYFSFLQGDRMTSAHLAELFKGSERKPETRITQREMDLAASVQVLTEEILGKMLRYAHKLTGLDNCVMAGGVALNCVANGKLIKNGPFKDIWIQPAAGDAGGALGAALDYYFQKIDQTGTKKQSIQTHAYLGPEFSASEIQSFLESNRIKYWKFKNKANEVSEWLAEGKIIGYFDGRMEFGPRALGNRSFIADPTNPEMQRKVNLKIKYRESFRPFAPIAAEEKLADYFDIDRPSPFMLIVAPVVQKLRKNPTPNEGSEDDLLKIVNQVRSSLPAITHVDASARLQSVNNHDNNNLQFYEILKAFEKRSGYAVLVNTSFNVRGEPIVCSPEDAFRCFMRTETDVLVLGNYYLNKSEQPEWTDNDEWKETFELD